MRIALILDSDGVVLDTERAARIAFERAMRSFGLNCDAGYTRYAGITDERLLEVLAEIHGASFEPRPFLRELREQEDRAAREQPPEPFPGIAEALGAIASAGIPLALASSAYREKIDFNYKRHPGVYRLFNVVLTGNDVEKGKPDPEIFIAAASRLGVAASRCLVVEDAPQGLLAARRAGSRAIAVATTFSASKLSEADLILQAPASLSVALVKSFLIT